MVHRLPEKVTGIKIKEGLYLPCLGYISGTWTDFDVCQQRKLFELYVVDACFLPVGVNAELPMFAFRRKKPEELQYHEGKKSPTFLDRGFINRALGKVISSEKRAFCARLNPSFHKPSRHYRCTMRIIGAMATGKCTCPPKLDIATPIHILPKSLYTSARPSRLVLTTCLSSHGQRRPQLLGRNGRPRKMGPGL